jgi:hypothetical protein
LPRRGACLPSLGHVQETTWKGSPWTQHNFPEDQDAAFNFIFTRGLCGASCKEFLSAQGKSATAGLILGYFYLRGNCKKNYLFYQSICHPLRLLKIPQVAILGFLFLLLDSYTAPLLQKLCALTHPLSLLANPERL